MTRTASVWLKGRPPAQSEPTLIERLKAGMYDVPFSTAELLREAAIELESLRKALQELYTYQLPTSALNLIHAALVTQTVTENEPLGDANDE